ncbi:MAG: hypothetical protein JRI25_04210 [Deltaproteobacteria bacterium]|nr:hypothetical protein [Deltaproteobacteria bacterium]
MNRILAIVILLVGVLSALGAGPSASFESDDHAHVASLEHSNPVDGCDAPCPGESEDGTCDPGCDDCACCPALTASPAVPGAPPAPTRLAPGYTSDRYALDVGRPNEGPRSRIFHPPRSALS